MVTELRIFVEAAIDFPEEEIDFLVEGKVRERLSDIIEQVEVVRREATQGSLTPGGYAPGHCR